MARRMGSALGAIERRSDRAPFNPRAEPLPARAAHRLSPLSTVVGAAMAQIAAALGLMSARDTRCRASGLALGSVD